MPRISSRLFNLAGTGFIFSLLLLIVFFIKVSITKGNNLAVFEHWRLLYIVPAVLIWVSILLSIIATIINAVAAFKNRSKVD